MPSPPPSYSSGDVDAEKAVLGQRLPQLGGRSAPAAHLCEAGVTEPVSDAAYGFTHEPDLVTLDERERKSVEHAV